MSITIALVGNPNSGKTTLFNALTGSNQFVGNWPGVTVEKKEGRLRANKEILIMDLPGIYSMSPYSMEEIVSRNYLIDEHPDAILNIVDGTNLERNLYLTTQLLELGIPVVIAVNMLDILQKKGERIKIDKLEAALGCRVVEISALKSTGIDAAVEAAVAAATLKTLAPMHRFSGGVEHAIAHIEEAVAHDMPESQQRWYSIKLFERDEKIAAKLGIDETMLLHIDNDIKKCERELDDESVGIIISERYSFIESVVKECIKSKKHNIFTTSDKIDRIVTNRILALPIFAAVMFIVYFVSVTTVGGLLTDWMNDGVFGDGWHPLGIGSSEYEEAFELYEQELLSLELQGFDLDELDEALLPAEPEPESFGVWVPGIPVLVGDLLVRLNTADWLQGLILDGIIAGVGAVLGFVPQILVLFIFLAFLEACGYMARIAFIMDKIFRKFGLSGKSFIPIIIGTGCGVPGIMASRTIESDRDRKMTIITTTFIPCGAKLPIVALIAGAMFGGAWWVAPVAYFVGIAAIVCSGIILKKTKMFAGSVAPFVMELPAYHMPTLINVLRSMWERGWSFIKKAGTIILVSSVFIWFTSGFGFTDGSFGMVDMEDSILATIGHIFAVIFKPLGWGDWKMSVAAITGLIAKENVVGTFGVLFGFAEVADNGAEVWAALAASFTSASAMSFLIFNLLCAPCFAAMGAIKREMNNARWFWFAVGYQTVLAYAVALCINHFGILISGGGFGIGTAVAILIVIGFLYLLLRKPPVDKLKVMSNSKPTLKV